MSRFPNEDWQRRKNYLIRSLFHDIPPYQGLSPILEESTQSSQRVTEESSRSSDTQDTKESSSSYEDQVRSISEVLVSTETSGSDPVLADNEQIILATRPHSPLPPLIIEVEPNRHDEDEEYYAALLVKMRRIYKKMFMEGKHISDEEFMYSDIEEIFKETNYLNRKGSSCHSHVINVDFNPIASDEICILGYKNVTEIANLDKAGDSSEDADDVKWSEHEDIGSDKDTDYEMDMEEESSAIDEEPAFAQITCKADIHVDGTPLPLVQPSPVYEEPRIEPLPGPDKRFSFEITESHELLPGSLRHDTNLSSAVSASEITSILMHKNLSHDSAQIFESAGQHLQLKRSPFHEKSRVASTLSLIQEKTSLETTQNLSSDTHLEEALAFDTERSNKSPIITFRSRYRKPKEAIIDLKTLFQDNQDNIHTQSTAEAQINTEALKSDVATGTKEDPVFVLRFRKTIEERYFSAESNSTMLEDNQEPDVTPSIRENDDSIKELEVMRTPRPDEFRESSTTGPIRFSNNSDCHCSLNITAPNISDITPPLDNGKHIRPVQQKESGDIHEILDPIPTSTPEVVRQTVLSSSIERGKISSQSLSNRKRHYKESSVQTSDVSWNELRDKFFVGTPKILKICSCVGHTCVKLHN